MDITITCEDINRENIIEDVIHRINLCAEHELEWKIQHFGESLFISVECRYNVGSVITLFDKLLESYPMLDISARYSYDIREEDTSAYWFCVDKMETVHKEDGTAYIERNSSTYWN